MRQKLSKKLRRAAGELTTDQSFTSFPRRAWGKNSLVANYRRMKKAFLNTPRPLRKTKLAELDELL